MDEQDKSFLMEVFKETGAHLRTTKRKSLIVTGAYIGLFSVFLSSLARTCLSDPPVTLSCSWLSIGIQMFFLLIGTCIYVMQQWYRAWKEHYLEVCLTQNRIKKSKNLFA